MYLIIMPAVMVPAIAALFGLERRAHRQGLINMAAAKKGIEDEEAEVEIENKVSRPLHFAPGTSPTESLRNHRTLNRPCAKS